VADPHAGSARDAPVPLLAVCGSWSDSHPGGDERAPFLSNLGRWLANRTVQVRWRRWRRAWRPGGRIRTCCGIPSPVICCTSGDLRAGQSTATPASPHHAGVISLDFQRWRRSTTRRIRELVGG
jgi:hypothetical protein